MIDTLSKLVGLSTGSFGIGPFAMLAVLVLLVVVSQKL